MESDFSIHADTGDGFSGQLYARVWKISGSTYPDDETIDAIINTVVPQIARLPGYCGGYVLAACEGGAFLRVSFWDSLEHLHDADVATTNAIAGIMVVTSGGTVSLDVCDVLMSDPPPRVRSSIPAGDD